MSGLDTAATVAGAALVTVVGIAAIVASTARPRRPEPDRHQDDDGNVVQPDPYVLSLMADLERPPFMIDHARIGDRVLIDREWTENGYPMGDQVDAGEVIAAWNHGDPLGPTYQRAGGRRVGRVVYRLGDFTNRDDDA